MNKLKIIECKKLKNVIENPKVRAIEPLDSKIFSLTADSSIDKLDSEIETAAKKCAPQNADYYSVTDIVSSPCSDGKSSYFFSVHYYQLKE